MLFAPSFVLGQETLPADVPNNVEVRPAPAVDRVRAAAPAQESGGTGAAPVRASENAIRASESAPGAPVPENAPAGTKASARAAAATSTPESPATPASETGVATSPAPDRTAELLEQLARQQEEIAALRKAMDEGFAAEAEARKRVEASAAENAKAVVEAAAQRAPKVAGIEGLTLSGFTQADLYLQQSSEDQLDPSTGKPLNNDRFSIRRARLRASIYREYLGAVMEIDANTINGAQVRPMDMEATVQVPGPEAPYVSATVGIFKIPYGFEIGQKDYERLFAERSNLEQALFPGEYDLGARVAGGWRFIRYALAVQNGQPAGESTFPYLDPNAGKDVVGRLGMASSLGENVYVQGGFSGLTGTGFHAGTPPTKPTVTYQDRNEDGALDPGDLIVSPGTAGTPSRTFSRYALGADLLLSAKTSPLGQTTVYGEITWAKNLDRAKLLADPYGPLGRNMRERGYYLALVQDLGRYLQAGVRYDYYDPDLDSTDRVSAVVLLSSQAMSTLALAAAVRWTIGGLTNRLLIEYDVNRNHAGISQAGLPTNLADNLFTMRAETVF
ncbi:MAG: hypothetical protein ABSB49_10685 [Polyangia bacterium]